MLKALAILANELDCLREFVAADFVTELMVMAAGDVEPPFSLEEASVIAEAIGINLDSAKFDIRDFSEGLRVELEHGVRDPETDVVHKNYLNLGRIAWAHLKEDPKYYTKLKLVEST